jgi:hypothetical protein
VEPIQDVVRGELGDPPLAIITTYQVVSHRFEGGVAELAQAIGFHDRVGRAAAEGGADGAIASSGQIVNLRSIPSSTT